MELEHATNGNNRHIVNFGSQAKAQIARLGMDQIIGKKQRNSQSSNFYSLRSS
jgi:hypothetical protein